MKRMDHTAIKERNLRYVLNLIRQHGPISRAELSKRTGLSRSTVSELMTDLIQADLVEEAGNGASAGGRRPIMLLLRPKSRLIFAIHVNDAGTAIARLEDLAGELIKAGEITVEAANLPQQLLALMERLAGPNLGRVARVGLGLPGVVSWNGDIISAVNLGWTQVAVSQPLSTRLGIPVLAENATGLAAYGEAIARQGNNQDVVYVRIGSVVGAGIVTNGQIHRGLRGGAAEIGHMVVDPEGPVCKCGRRGCLEARVSWAGVSSLVKSRLSHYGDVPIERLFDALVAEHPTTPEIQAILEEIAVDIAQAITNVVNLIGPQAIVIESVLTNSPVFWESLTRLVRDEALPLVSGQCCLLKSQLGEEAVLKGASAFAREHFFQHYDLHS